MSAKSYGLELCEPETASAWRIKTMTGSHRFIVEGYSLERHIGTGMCLTSPNFTIGGYEWSIVCYPNGENVSCKDYLSFYLEFKSQASNVKAAFKFALLIDHKRPKLDLPSPVILRGKGSKMGIPRFMERKRFETSEHLKDDSFEVMCVVKVVQSQPPCLETMQFGPVTVPPSNLDQQFHHLLKSGDGADVTFRVDGNIFKAHKVILGARSRVFHVQFFGQMKEKQADCVELDNIEVEVFRVFLGFIYSDSVSKLEEDIKDSKQEAMFMYQHLLVAADRYEVERLKLICENKLSLNLEVKNLATTLTLAEQHNCPHLKASWFKFLDSNNLAAVMRTEESVHLNRSCPNILKELAESRNQDK